MNEYISLDILAFVVALLLPVAGSLTSWAMTPVTHLC